MYWYNRNWDEYIDVSSRGVLYLECPLSEVPLY